MTPEFRQRLGLVGGAALCDADKAVRVCDAGLRPAALYDEVMVGVAHTVRCHDDFLSVIKALDESSAGEVLVVDTGGSTRAVVGELFSIEAERRGLAGIIVDGPVRDTETLRTLSLPVWSRGYCPCSGTTQQLTETQIPVTCGGVQIAPGDVIVADHDGIVVIAPDQIEARLAAAEAIADSEAKIIRRMEAGEGLLGMLNFADHVAALERGEASSLAFRIDD